MPTHIDLSHVITDGMVTYPGLPAPSIDVHLSREAAVEVYGPDITFTIGIIEICTNTEHFGADSYTINHPHLTEASAVLLRDVDVSCVGIDSLNIDSTDGGERPVHTTLLRADIPIIEHLTNLAQLPSDGFTFTAVPPKIEKAGTFTVRAFATLLA